MNGEVSRGEPLSDCPFKHGLCRKTANTLSGASSGDLVSPHFAFSTKKLHLHSHRCPLIRRRWNCDSRLGMSRTCPRCRSRMGRKSPFTEIKLGQGDSRAASHAYQASRRRMESLSVWPYGSVTAVPFQLSVEMNVLRPETLDISRASHYDSAP